MDQAFDYIKENWPSIKEKIQRRKYKPQPVLRVEIPKPNGGVRKLFASNESAGGLLIQSYVDNKNQ